MTIYETVMPDLPQRKAALQSLIAQHINPDFAARICGELTPMFFFISQKSWELLDDPIMVENIEDWVDGQKVLSPELVKMISWLLLILDNKREDEKHEQVHKLLAKHLIATDRKPKLRPLLLKLLNNPDESFSALSLAVGEEISRREPKPSSGPISFYELQQAYKTGELNKLLINCTNTCETFIFSSMDMEDLGMEEGAFLDGEGCPVLEDEGNTRFKGKNREKDEDSTSLYKKYLMALLEKEKTSPLSADELAQKKFYQTFIQNGKTKYNHLNSNRVTANIRSQRNNAFKGLDKKLGDPRLGSAILNEGFQNGLKCKWKSRGVYKKMYAPWGLTPLPDKFYENIPRWWLLESELLKSLSYNDMCLLHTFYEAGSLKKRHPQEAVSLEKCYEFISKQFYKYSDAELHENYRIETEQGYEVVIQDTSLCLEACYDNLGCNHDFFPCLEAGLEYYKVI